MNKQKCCGLVTFSTGICLLALAFVFWAIMGAIVLGVLKGSNFITSPDSDLFADWECSFRSGDPDPVLSFEVFYVLNMTNPDEVLNGSVPIYDERGPYVYWANYTKFKISFLENDIVEYKRCKTFYQDMDRSSGPDSEMVININPGYLGAVFATGDESTLLLVLAGPEIERMIIEIEEKYVNQTLIPNGGFDFWLARCQGLDPTCSNTRDMATIQWGYYSNRPVILGLNDTEVNEVLPADFPWNNAEFSAFMRNQLIPAPGNEMNLERTSKLLYGDKGIVKDPANIEYLAASLGNETALAVWGLDGGRALPFLRYALSISETYSLEFLQSLIDQGSGLLRRRTVWEILWEDIDPLLVVLQPWDPYGNIFFNYTTIEVADALTGFWRINSGKADSRVVEELTMWEGFEVVDYFWSNYDIPVSGNSGNGQFAPGKMDWLGNPPEQMEDIVAWSQDHGRPVVFADTTEIVEFYGVKTHLFAMVNETYEPNPLYDLTAPEFYGLVNATSINFQVPVYYCQPRMLLVDQKWRDKVKGVQEPTELDQSFLWIEPYTGLALKAEVKLQVNFYVPPASEMDLFNVIYKTSPRDIMYPLVWTQQEALLKEQDAEDLKVELFSLLDAAVIVWYVVWALSGILVVLGILVWCRAPANDYEKIGSMNTLN